MIGAVHTAENINIVMLERFHGDWLVMNNNGGKNNQIIRYTQTMAKRQKRVQ